MNRTRQTNPWQLVMRRDTATGLTHIGWAEDLPLGRFEHLALVCEASTAVLPVKGSEQYPAYQLALENAQQSNIGLLEQQASFNRSRGWYAVPFTLVQDRDNAHPDSVGSYAAAAMQLHYQLAGHCKRVWAIMNENRIVHVRARYPKKELDALTAQVWYFRQLNELQTIGGQLLEGTLIVCESGLWLSADQTE